MSKRKFHFQNMKFLILISLFIVGTQGGFRCTFGNWACTAGCVVLGQTSGKKTNSGHFTKIDLWSIYEFIKNKNAAKKTRQQSGLCSAPCVLCQ